MTQTEFFTLILPFFVRNAAFIVFYFIIGFGPGFIAGILLANRIFGEGPSILDTHITNIQKANEHNAQWHPDNQKWKK